MMSNMFVFVAATLVGTAVLGLRTQYQPSPTQYLPFSDQPIPGIKSDLHPSNKFRSAPEPAEEKLIVKYEMVCTCCAAYKRDHPKRYEGEYADEQIRCIGALSHSGPIPTELNEDLHKQVCNQNQDPPEGWYWDFHPPMEMQKVEKTSNIAKCGDVNFSDNNPFSTYYVPNYSAGPFRPHTGEAVVTSFFKFMFDKDLWSMHGISSDTQTYSFTDTYKDNKHYTFLFEKTAKVTSTDQASIHPKMTSFKFSH